MLQHLRQLGRSATLTRLVRAEPKTRPSQGEQPPLALLLQACWGAHDQHPGRNSWSLYRYVAVSKQQEAYSYLEWMNGMRLGLAGRHTCAMRREVALIGSV